MTKINYGEIHQEARYNFDRIQEALKDERQQCVNDRRFYSTPGAQWEGKLGDQFENKPKLEVNKLHLSVIRIFNEYRNNRITVDFVSKVGESKDDLADMCDGLYRATEQDSVSSEAYDNAFEEAIGGGYGAWRLRSEYEDEFDEDNDKQKVLIEPIYEADTSVYFDLDAKRYDKADARYCFVLSSMTFDAFERAYNENPSSWNKSIINTTYFDWVGADVVYVAEYYQVEEVKESVLIYKTIDGREEKYSKKDFELDEELEGTLLAIGTKFERERKIKTRRVRKLIMSGEKVLEDCGYIAGKNIPIVPMYGKRWFVDNIERCMGHVRLAKDSQRIKNMQMSKLAEISALSTVEKPILTPEQIANHQLQWEEDNIKNYPYLLLNPIKDANGNQLPAGPLAYTKVPNVPPAMAALLSITDADIREILGSQEAGEKIHSNLSGKAVELVQNRLDMQTYIYMSNMAKSIKRSGEIWLSMAKDIYVESGRKMKIITPQGEMDSLQLMTPIIDEETGEQIYKNDFSNVDFDVYADVGPSSQSKRDSMNRSLIEMLQLTQDQETSQILSSMILMNFEGEGLKEAKDFFRRRLIKMGVVNPTKDEMKELAEEAQNAPSDPNTEYMLAAAEQAQAEAAQLRAKTALTISQAEETQTKSEKIKAETMETLAGINAREEERAIELMQGFQNSRQ